MAHSSYFNGSLYQRMSEDLHLGGMSQRTHAGYLRAVRKLADYCQISPDKITEDQLRRFFLHMKNELNYAYGTLRGLLRHQVLLDEVQWLVWLYLGWTFWLASGYARRNQNLFSDGPCACAECGGEMRIVGVVDTNCRALIEHSVDFLDSG